EAIKAGNSGSSVWYDPEHNIQLLASYAPIREDGEVIGGIVIGTAFNDERLAAISTNPDVGLFAAVPKGEGLVVAAKAGPITDDMTKNADAAKTALDAGQVVALSGFMEGYDAAAKSLTAYGDGKQGVVVAVAEISTVGGFGSLIGPFLVVLVLGLILTAVAAHLIDNYISQPISDLEDGLLTVINGQTDIRFELEHKVLGGLVHRINSLLNQLLGVAEDDTDEQGRPSTAPSSSSFTAALNVDERMASLSLNDVADAAKLRDEAPEDYYKRIYDEYLAAKRSIGDPVDHIRFQQFQNRIKGLEQQLMTKHGKPFRYQVEAKGKEVVFVAVPLA
ncbi:MAG: MXAN_5187 C-terminal domain-containing protein, partial [Polyangiaceae bacterium]